MNNTKNDVREYQLSSEELATLNEYQQAAHDIQQQIQGVLRLLSRQRKLEGNWSLQGDKLVRSDNVNVEK